MRSRCGVLKETSCFLAGPKQFLDALPQRRITRASFVQVRGTLAGGQSPGYTKDSHFAINWVTHLKSDTLPFNAKNQTKRRKAIS